MQDPLFLHQWTQSDQNLACLPEESFVPYFLTTLKGHSKEAPDQEWMPRLSWLRWVHIILLVLSCSGSYIKEHCFNTVDPWLP